MASKRQFAANRQNALKSTGPRSATGKARSGRNATTHGLAAKQALLPGEDAAEFEQFLGDLVGALGARGPLELQLVEWAAGLMWRLRRIPSFEAALFTRADTDIRNDPGETLIGEWWTLKESGQRQAFELGRIVERLLRSDVISKLSRYEVTLQRQLSATLAELRQVMASRPEPAPLERPSVMQLPFRPQAEPQPAAGAETTGSDPRDELLVG